MLQLHRFKGRTTVVQPESFMAVASARLSRASGVIFCRRRRQASSFPPPAPDNGLSAPCMWPRCFPSRRGLTAECDVEAFRGSQRRRLVATLLSPVTGRNVSVEAHCRLFSPKTARVHTMRLHGYVEAYERIMFLLSSVSSIIGDRSVANLKSIST